MLATVVMVLVGIGFAVCTVVLPSVVVVGIGFAFCVIASVIALVVGLGFEV